MRPAHILASLLMILSVVATAISASKALAAQPCTADPGRGSGGTNSHAGVKRYVGSQVGGVYAEIEQYNVPRMVHSLRGEVNDYVMVELSTYQYGQFGISYTGSGLSHIEVFSEVNNNSAPQTRWNSIAGAGANPYFTVLYDLVPGKFTFQLNGAQWLPEGTSGGYNPTAGFVPNAAEISGEILYLNDQLPGDNTDAAGHYDAHIYVGGWQAFSGSMYSEHSDFWTDPATGSAPYSGIQFYFWDHKCPHFP